MRYLLLVYGSDTPLDATERTRETDASGHTVAAAPVPPTPAVRAVRMQNGKPLVTDGPFAETREQPCGYVPFTPQ